MKFKNLLSLGAMLSCGLVAQAQVPVFHESFEAAQTKQPTDVGYYEEINKEEGDDWSIAPGGAEGNCFNFFNSIDVLTPDNFWRRAVKFRNLPLEAGKSYRLSFRFKGSNTYSNGETDVKAKMRVGLMQGVENADISILGAGDKDQYREVSYFNPNEYEKYNLMYYFADKANQDAKYYESCSGNKEYNEANKDKYFATFNVFNPGDYYLDEVELVEANIAGIIYNGNVIRVDLGYATNAKTLAGTKGYYVLPNDCVTVTVGGSEVVVESVEARSDGYLYIFLDKEAGEGEVEVQFRNPAEGGLQYAEGEAITGNVLNFTEKAELKGTFNENGDIESWIYDEAQCVATTPLDGSFALDGNISEFTFTFDREVYSVANDARKAPVATLSDGTALKLKEGTPETTKTLTFVREGADLAKGSYSVTLKNIVTAVGTESKDATLSFEVGKIQLAETIYTDLGQTLISGENGGIPEGWTCMVKGTAGDWTSGEVWGGGSACRNMDTKGQMTFYLCDRDGFTYLMYGDKEDARITLPAGDIEFSIMGVGHEAAARTLEFRLEDMDGNEVAYTSGNTSVKAENFTTIEAAGAISVQFNNPKEQNFILKIHEPQGGYTAARVIGFKAQSYVVTEGDKPDSKIVFEEAFTANGANMPSAESGWLCYDNNKQLDPGSARNGTSGFLQRNYGSKMQNAFLLRECGTNEDAAHRLTFADELSGHAPLELPAGSYEITFYCGTWNDVAGNAAGTSKTFFQLIDADSGEPVVDHTHINIANFENGGKADGSVEADKVVIPFNTEGGSYQIKAWGTHNTVVGAFSIEKQGSKAAKYYKKIADAVELAKKELVSSEDAANDGDTKSKLLEAVAVYSGELNMHTAAEFDEAVAKIESLTAALTLRRETIIKYDAAKNDIAAMIEGIENKYDALDCVQSLKKSYSSYQDVTAQSLDDAELISATSTLEFDLNTTKHMTTDGVATLTEQIVKLAAKLVELDETKVDDQYVIAAGNAISDDQSLASQLRLCLTKAIYEKCAVGNPFEDTHYDEVLMEDVTEETPIDASMYVWNPNVYCVAEKHDATNISNYPGWHAEEGKETFGLRPNYGWGGWTGNATHLVNNNMFLGIGWIASDGINVWNEVDKLPVGVYQISIETMDRSGVGDDSEGNKNVVVDPSKQQSYIYYQQPDMEEPVQKAFDVTNIGTYYDFTEDIFDGDITLSGENTASLKIGAYIHAEGSFSAIRKVRLSLKGKATGFDYAAAANRLTDEIAASIEKTPAAPEGAPASVAYYDLSGRQVAQPQGVAIKVEKWANGYTKVSKVVEK